MTKDSKEERRRHSRYDTEIDVYYSITYELETKVEYTLIDRVEKKPLSKKYHGLTRNVSVKGLSFVSSQKLNKGDLLHLEVFIPKDLEPVLMEGEVRWCAPREEKDQFETGIELVSVNHQPIDRSIYFDEKYKVYWSNVLELTFGSFRKLIQTKTCN